MIRKKIGPLNQKTTIGTVETEIMVDSGSVCTIIESLASHVVATDEISFWIHGTNARGLQTYSNTPKPIVGKIKIQNDNQQSSSESSSNHYSQGWT